MRLQRFAELQGWWREQLASGGGAGRSDVSAARRELALPVEAGRGRRAGTALWYEDLLPRSSRRSYMSKVTLETARQENLSSGLNSVNVSWTNGLLYALFFPITLI